MNVVHIDEADSETPAITQAGVTHLATDCAGIDPDAPFVTTPLAGAGGWLCENCIDVEPHHGWLSATGMAFGEGSDKANGGGARKGGRGGPATEKQVALIERLVREQGIEDFTMPYRTKAEASDAIETLFAFAEKAKAKVVEAGSADAVDVAAMAARADRKFDVSEMTPDLIAFATEWTKGYTGDFGFMVDMLRKVMGEGVSLSAGQAKGVMNCWLAAVRRGDVVVGGAEPEADPVEGFYEIGDDIVKVQHGRNGNWYTKTMVDGAWEYTGRQVRPVPEQALSPERAAEFGHATGKCVICMRKLTDEESIDRGIGPVCIQRMGW